MIILAVTAGYLYCNHYDISMGGVNVTPNIAVFEDTCPVPQTVIL